MRALSSMRDHITPRERLTNILTKQSILNKIYLRIKKCLSQIINYHQM
jgi:hypothetical protein